VTRQGSPLRPVLALTALGAALRFPTLDRQSFWLDELVTVALLRQGLPDVLAEIPRTEATPYVYYVVAWAWGSVFGLGELGLRSLSALVGTATIPVAYGTGAVLVSRRAGLVAAALVAVNPFLVWYSQEARSYALLALLGAGTVLAFGPALRGDRRSLAAWAVLSALAIATHHFAAFLVAAEAVWLLARLRPSRAVAASLLPAAVLLAHVPLVLAQRDNAEAVTGSSLAARIAGIPKNLAVGYSFPAEALGSALAALLLVFGLALVVRAAPADRSGALVAGSLAVAAIAVPVVLALAGVDFLVARNTIVAVVPAAVCVAAGCATSRLGLAAAGALCVVSAAVALAPALDTRYGRTDWRGAAEALGNPDGARAIVVTPYMSRALWRPYLPDLREPPAEGALVREIAVVGLATEGGYSTGPVEPPRREPSPAPEGFRLVSSERGPTYTLVLYRADEPTLVPVSTLDALALADEQPGVLLQAADGLR
jgi:mannosyltransferase